MEDTVKTRRNPLAWFSKHKKLTALLLVVLIAAVLVLRAVLGGKKAAGSTYQFVRTSTLQKTSLTDSVSVNGTVKSGYEASVTVADSAKLYKVSEVKVGVGDTVKKGDVIATLDTSDLEKQIESAEESYGDTLKSARPVMTVLPPTWTLPPCSTRIASSTCRPRSTRLTRICRMPRMP